MIGCVGEILLQAAQPLAIERAAGVAVDEDVTRRQFGEPGGDHVRLPGPEAVSMGVVADRFGVSPPVVEPERPLVERADAREPAQGGRLAAQPGERA